MDDEDLYPPGSIGYERRRIRRELEALVSDYPDEVQAILEVLDETEAKMNDARDAALWRFFTGTAW